jgi:hypothetical protein
MKKLLTALVLSSTIGIGFVLIGFYYSKNTIFHGFNVVGICILLGIAIKMMDQLIDEIKNKSYRIYILLLAIFIPSSITYLALTEEPVVGMVIGTAIGMLIAGKLDHPAYLVSISLFILLVFIVFLLNIIKIEITTFLIIPVAATGSFLDEFGHERWKSDKKSITFIFKHRFFLKIFACFSVVLGLAKLIHIIGFLCFDIFYDIIESVYNYDIRKKSISYNSRQWSNKEDDNA